MTNDSDKDLISVLTENLRLLQIKYGELKIKNEENKKQLNHYRNSYNSIKKEFERYRLMHGKGFENYQYVKLNEYGKLIKSTKDEAIGYVINTY